MHMPDQAGVEGPPGPRHSTASEAASLEDSAHDDAEKGFATAEGVQARPMSSDAAGTFQLLLNTAMLLFWRCVFQGSAVCVMGFFFQGANMASESHPGRAPTPQAWCWVC